LSKAVEWGLVDRNAIKGQVRKNAIPKRNRYLEDSEIREALTVASAMLRAYVVLKLLTALRRADLLRLRVSDMKENGIHVATSKTGKYLIMGWTDELREAINAAIGARPKDIVPWLFCTRNGDPYIHDNGSANAFDSLWQRFMARVVANTKVARFQEKDLRKKTASDMGLIEAQRLLGHTTSATTERHYRLRGEIVRPHSLRHRK
jgi:integrase